MPISLLPELTTTLLRTGRALAPWNQLVRLEEQLLRRARGAFLVRWFGTQVPEVRLSLSVVIVNIDALRERYLAVRRSAQAGPAGPNLTGPLAGMAGFLVGVVASFPGVIMLATYADQIFARLVGDNLGAGILTMLFSLLGGWIVPPLALLLGAAATPLLLGLGLGAGLGHEPTRAVVLLLGETAALITATVAFWGQLSGPRGEVRNPLVARILTFADSLARGVAHTLGFVAVLVTRIAPLVPNLLAQYRAFMGLLGAVRAALVDTLSGFAETLMAPFREGRGLAGTITDVVDAFAGLPGMLVDELTALLDQGTVVVLAARTQAALMVSTWFVEVKLALTALFGRTVLGALVERVQQLRALLPDIRRAFLEAPEPPAEESDDTLDSWWLNALTIGLTHDIRDMLASVGELAVPGLPDVTVPEFPSLPAAPDVQAAIDRLGRPDLDTEALGRQLEDAARFGGPVLPELLARPRSVFATDRARLDALGRPALRPPHSEPFLLGDEQLRDLIHLAVGRVLPAELRVVAPKVREMFDALDEAVYDIEREPLAQPVLELEDNGRLRPVVSRLTIRSDAMAADVRAFQDLLVGELEARTYAATAV